MANWQSTKTRGVYVAHQRECPANGLSLLYVGIAPRRPSSRQTLRTRIVGNHLRGNVGASTFRLSLAALLWEREGWRPHWRSTRVQLPPEDNYAAPGKSAAVSTNAWMTCLARGWRSPGGRSA